MENMNQLKDLLKHEVEDLRSAEDQIIEALPKMIEKANSQQLKDALTEHLEITEEHRNRLDKVMGLLNKEEGQEEEESGGGGFLSGLFGGGEKNARPWKGLLRKEKTC